jgi:hypothetical protein
MEYVLQQNEKIAELEHTITYYKTENACFDKTLDESMKFVGGDQNLTQNVKIIKASQIKKNDKKREKTTIKKGGGIIDKKFQKPKVNSASIETKPENDILYKNIPQPKKNNKLSSLSKVHPSTQIQYSTKKGGMTKKKNVLTPAQRKGFEELDHICKLNGELICKMEQPLKNVSARLYVKKYIDELRCEYEGSSNWKSGYKRLYNKLIKFYNNTMLANTTTSSTTTDATGTTVVVPIKKSIPALDIKPPITINNETPELGKKEPPKKTVGIIQNNDEIVYEKDVLLAEVHNEKSVNLSNSFIPMVDEPKDLSMYTIVNASVCQKPSTLPILHQPTDLSLYTIVADSSTWAKPMEANNNFTYEEKNVAITIDMETKSKTDMEIQDETIDDSPTKIPKFNLDTFVHHATGTTLDPKYEGDDLENMNTKRAYVIEIIQGRFYQNDNFYIKRGDKLLKNSIEFRPEDYEEIVVTEEGKVFEDGRDAEIGFIENNIAFEESNSARGYFTITIDKENLWGGYLVPGGERKKYRGVKNGVYPSHLVERDEKYDEVLHTKKGLTDTKLIQNEEIVF